MTIPRDNIFQDTHYFECLRNHPTCAEYMIARLQKLLDGRDQFIVDRGLWSDFVAQLPKQ